MVNISELKKQILFEDISNSELEKLAKVIKEVSLKKESFFLRKAKIQKAFI